MIILVLNVGSSSIKYTIFEQNETTLCVLDAGQITGIGTAWATWSANINSIECMDKANLSDHESALSLLAKHLHTHHAITCVVHRVVHGGPKLDRPCLINADTLQIIREAMPFAPLHNPIQCLAIEQAQTTFDTAKHVAVFDTSFHHTIPPHVHTYALPETMRTDGLRKYGFHGNSYGHVLAQAQAHFQKTALNLIVCHLGSGASVCAIRDGHAFDTSMGLTPCGGLMMGTRPGDMDPGVLMHLLKHHDMDHDACISMLNHDSGLKGLCGHNDMRTIENQALQGDTAAQLALDAFCHKVQFYIGGYHGILGHVDALIFTGGIGENAPSIRTKICQPLQNLGFMLDVTNNLKKATPSLQALHHKESTHPIFVIQTDEERHMAMAAMPLLKHGH